MAGIAVPKYYFEDYRVGDKWEMGRWSVSRDEMIAFAREYDPQPIHIDEEAADQGPYGGLIASGWQTIIKTTGMFLGGLMAESAGLGSPGLENIRWLKPVRADEVTAARAEIVESVPSRSRPDRGRIHVEFFGVDSSGENVMTCHSIFLLGRRPDGRSPADPRPGELDTAI